MPAKKKSSTSTKKSKQSNNKKQKKSAVEPEIIEASVVGVDIIPKQVGRRKGQKNTIERNDYTDEPLVRKKRAKPLAAAFKDAIAKEWLKHYLNNNNKETFLNATNSVFAAGSQCKTRKAASVVGCRFVKRYHEVINEFLDSTYLSVASLKAKTVELLDAKKVNIYADKGVVKDVVITEDSATQARALDMALRMKGMYNDRIEVETRGAMVVPAPMNPEQWKKLSEQYHNEENI